MYETFPIESNLSSEWKDFESNIPKASNYMISKELFLEAMNMKGVFGMITLSNIDIDYHGNHDDLESSIALELSQDLIKKFAETRYVSLFFQTTPIARVFVFFNKRTILFR